MKYPDQLNTKVSSNTKSMLKVIKDDTGITPRHIIEEFIKDYCSTKPKGINLKIKEIEKKIKELDNQMVFIKEQKTELEIELKTYKDSLNKTLDSYIDTDLDNAVTSIKNICKDRNYNSLEEIPEPTFISIAKANKIDVKDLKKEVLKELF